MSLIINDAIEVRTKDKKSNYFISFRSDDKTVGHFCSPVPEDIDTNKRKSLMWDIGILHRGVEIELPSLRRVFELQSSIEDLLQSDEDESMMISEAKEQLDNLLKENDYGVSEIDDDIFMLKLHLNILRQDDKGDFYIYGVRRTEDSCHEIIDWTTLVEDIETRYFTPSQDKEWGIPDRHIARLLDLSGKWSFESCKGFFGKSYNELKDIMKKAFKQRKECITHDGMLWFKDGKYSGQVHTVYGTTLNNEEIRNIKATMRYLNGEEVVVDFDIISHELSSAKVDEKYEEFLGKLYRYKDRRSVFKEFRVDSVDYSKFEESCVLKDNQINNLYRNCVEKLKNGINRLKIKGVDPYAITPKEEERIKEKVRISVETVKINNFFRNMDVDQRWQIGHDIKTHFEQVRMGEATTAEEIRRNSFNHCYHNASFDVPKKKEQDTERISDTGWQIGKHGEAPRTYGKSEFNRRVHLAGRIYLDTLDIMKNIFPELGKYKLEHSLKYLANYLGLQLPDIEIEVNGKKINITRKGVKAISHEDISPLNYLAELGDHKSRRELLYYQIADVMNTTWFERNLSSFLIPIINIHEVTSYSLSDIIHSVRSMKETWDRIYFLGGKKHKESYVTRRKQIYMKRMDSGFKSYLGSWLGFQKHLWCEIEEDKGKNKKVKRKKTLERVSAPENTIAVYIPIVDCFRGLILNKFPEYKKILEDHSVRRNLIIEDEDGFYDIDETSPEYYKEKALFNVENDPGVAVHQRNQLVYTRYLENILKDVFFDRYNIEFFEGIYNKSLGLCEVQESDFDSLVEKIIEDKEKEVRTRRLHWRMKRVINSANKFFEKLDRMKEKFGTGLKQKEYASILRSSVGIKRRTATRRKNELFNGGYNDNPDDFKCLNLCELVNPEIEILREFREQGYIRARVDKREKSLSLEELQQKDSDLYELYEKFSSAFEDYEHYFSNPNFSGVISDVYKGVTDRLNLENAVYLDLIRKEMKHARWKFQRRYKLEPEKFDEMKDEYFKRISEFLEMNNLVAHKQSGFTLYLIANGDQEHAIQAIKDSNCLTYACNLSWEQFNLRKRGKPK